MIKKFNFKNISKDKLFTIVATALLVLMHIAVVLAISLSWRYYAIYPSLFGSIVAIVVCFTIIVDIIFFIGFNHQDLALKIISVVLSAFLLIGGAVGTYFISKANGIVDNVLDNNSKYETYSGLFVSYKKNNTFTSLEDLAGKKVGMLVETTNGISYIAKGLLDDIKIDYAVVDYKTNTEMVQGLLDGDVDAIAITSAYREIYNPERDENSPFAKYLDDFNDFYSFEKELKVDSNRKNKNVSTDPFNVLLIGYSRTEIGSPVGLADSIIVATINPQTYTVSMMSIARDSFVPIACYGGEYDKINSGRSTSRACFIETVEDFINMDIDYYMELDYLGLVAIVNTIGGITINNPVDFELDGIFVPAGENVFADGQMALQFCRERHHMPNGDFDRQQHQKEVIIAIAEKFIQAGDVSLALKAMEEASDWMSTDLSLNQLTTLFNLLLNTKNFTTLDTFDLVDFQTLRITGSGGIKYYSYSMHLPLWVYLIYQGSYDESMQHVNDIMGNYKTINQERGFSFSIRDKYIAPELYSESYPNNFMFTPDPMPAYWASLDGMTLSEAMSWASENGVSLSVSETIMSNDPRYVSEFEGLVYSQSVRYGSLVSEYPYGTVTIMGPGEIDEDKLVPNFIDHSYSKAISWAENHGIPYSIDFNPNVDGTVGKVVNQSPKAFTDISNCDELKIVVKAGVKSIRFDKNGHGLDSEVPATIEIITGEEEVSFKNKIMSDVASDPKDGNKYKFLGWYTTSDNNDEKSRVYDSSELSGNVTLYAHWEKYCVHEWGEYKTVEEATCTKEGKEVRICTKCDKEDEPKIIAKKEHTIVNDDPEIPSTCTTHGKAATSHCSVCNKTFGGEELPLAEHNMVQTDPGSPAGCDKEGKEASYSCSECGATSGGGVIPADPSQCSIPEPEPQS